MLTYERRSREISIQLGVLLDNLAIRDILPMTLLPKRDGIQQIAGPPFCASAHHPSEDSNHYLHTVIIVSGKACIAEPRAEIVDNNTCL